MSNCQGKFWLERLAELVCNFEVIPTTNMTLSAQLNALTRLVVLISIILLLFNLRYGLIFLFVGLIFLIILYYTQRKKMSSVVENFLPWSNNANSLGPPPGCSLPNPGCTPPLANCTPQTAPPSCGPSNNCPGPCGTAAEVTYFSPASANLAGSPCPLRRSPDRPRPANTPESTRFCHKEWPVGPQNGDLFKGAYPRVYSTPVIVPPSHDLCSWRANDLVVHSHINAETEEPIGPAGYISQPCCDERFNKPFVPTPEESLPTYRYVYKDGTVIGGEHHKGITKYGSVLERYSALPSAPSSADHPQDVSLTYGEPIGESTPEQTSQLRENFDFKTGHHDDVPLAHFVDHPVLHPEVVAALHKQYQAGKDKRPYDGTMCVGSSDVLDSCNYDPSQLFKYDLPVNYQSAPCQRTEEMADYNRNLFTSYIQPGVFYNNEKWEPAIWNEGISFTQQFGPVTERTTDQGDIMFTEHDPRIVERQEREFVEGIAPWNTTDPRSAGYGTSYRGYLDHVTGQARFAYDDIDAIREPNYIVRSKIDNQLWADSYGPLTDEDVCGNDHTGNIRKLAQDAWFNQTNSHRLDLQQSLMRKYNSEVAPARKIAPLRADARSKLCH